MENTEDQKHCGVAVAVGKVCEELCAVLGGYVIACRSCLQG